MNPEERSLLERIYKMTEENNQILISMRRTARIGVVMKVLYWVVIIGLSFGAIYFIQPYLNFVSGALGGDKNKTVDSTPSTNYIETLQDLLK